MNKKRYLKGTEPEKAQLRSYIRSSPDTKSVHRAQAILWSMEGRDRVDLASLFHVKADTISNWFERWDSQDLSKLRDDPRSGRPPMLNESEKKTF